MHVTVFHMRDTKCMCTHVKQSEEEKSSDRELVGLFVAQCFSLTGRGSGRGVTAEADSLNRSVVHSRPASHHTVLTVKPWSVGWNPSVYPAKNRFHTLRWRGISWQDPLPSSAPHHPSPSSSSLSHPDCSAERVMPLLVCSAQPGCMPPLLKSCLT